MYQALTINEIQSEIFSYPFEWTDLFSLAVSCKTLSREIVDIIEVSKCLLLDSENALRSLWRAPPDLGCLIRTMPSDLWTEMDMKQGKRRACLKFIRELSETDWDRFDYYAPMIRVMNFKTRIPSEKGHPCVNVSVQLRVYSAFNLYASMHNRDSLLPRLHSASFVDEKDYPFTIPPLAKLLCFLSSKLTSLELKLNHLSIPETVANMIMEKSPNITSLTADFKPNLDRFVFCVDPLLSKLTSISGDLIVDTQMGDYLGTLPLLKSMRTLTIGNRDNVSSFTTDGGRFPSLIDLQIKASFLTTTGQLLQILQCPLETLHIISRYYFACRDPMMSDLTAALGCNPQLQASLTKVIISITNTHIMDVECHSDDYQPLFLLRALQHLVIDVSGINIWTIGDHWLAEGALAWPKIQTLVIANFNSNFTLKGLVPLITRCLNITHLDVSPRVIAFDLSLLPRDGSGTNHNLKGTLSVGGANPCTVDPPAVYACIKAMFPNVTDITLDPGRSILYLRDSNPFLQKWVELEGLFKRGQSKSHTDESDSGP